MKTGAEVTWGGAKATPFKSRPYIEPDIESPPTNNKVYVEPHKPQNHLRPKNVYVSNHSLQHINTDDKQSLCFYNILIFTTCVTRNGLSKTWIRPINPVKNGAPSYAVAWSSQRDDGSPYTISNKLESLDLTHASGYRVTDLFNKNRFVQDILPKQNITVRVNPSGVVFYKFTPK